MKKPSLRALFLSLGTALSLAFPGGASAYDSPDFDAGVFSRDGLFLTEDQKTTLLNALAALASDFSSSDRVDDDLREKALGIALLVDPMHVPSRLAHRALSHGEAPAATHSRDTLGAVSETLWTLASQLTSAPLEPEHQRLAPFLMELSLLTHATPSNEHLADFAAITPEKHPGWGKFLSLQPDENRSTRRARFLREEGLKILRQRKEQEREALLAASAPGRPDTADKTPGPTDAPATPAMISPDNRERPERPPRPAPMEPVVASLPVVRLVEAGETTPVAGVFTLTMRPPAGRAERDLLRQGGPNAPAEAATVSDSTPRAVPLVPSRQGIAFESLEIPAALVADRNWEWPTGAIGEVAFSATAPAPGPRRLLRARALLPGAALIDSLLRKAPINDQMILSGEIEPASSEIVLPGGVVPTIEAAAGMKGKYLLLPASVAEDLIAHLVKTGQLGLLFSNELLSYDTLAEAIDRVSAPTPESLVAASQTFREIERVTDRMPLIDLARNDKVMERLETILATHPEHLSAHAMLEFGRTPESPELRISLAATRINELVTPLFGVDDPTADLDALALRLDPAMLELSRLRTEVPPEVRDFHSAGVDFLEACERYLQITNKGTSTGLQRLRESQESRATFVERGVDLGLLYPKREVE
ncbi:MAG: hypothetical protein GXX91_04730 [Verrucomicrobiaceae bacterium]|nr:hypothetical protein [Verrucomicrobiaceae bacterium]